MGQFNKERTPYMGYRDTFHIIISEKSVIFFQRDEINEAFYIDFPSDKEMLSMQDLLDYIAEEDFYPVAINMYGLLETMHIQHPEYHPGDRSFFVFLAQQIYRRLQQLKKKYDEACQDVPF